MTTDTTLQRVAIIGLGNMGSALADNILAARLPLKVWNRSPEKVEGFSARGAVAATNPAKAAEASDVIMICVTDHAAVEEILGSEGMAEALKGKILAQLGVVTAEESRQTAAWAEANGTGYLEASIIGLPENVRAQSATLICSGPAAVFDRCAGLIAQFGAGEFLSETRGAAYDFDKTFYTYGYSVMLGFLQAAAIAKTNGISLGVLARVMQARTPAIVERLVGYAKAIAEGNFEGDQATIDIWADGFDKALEHCRRSGVDDALPSAVMTIFEKARAQGLAGKELPAVVDVLLPAEAD